MRCVGGASSERATIGSAQSCSSTHLQIVVSAGSLSGVVERGHFVSVLIHPAPRDDRDSRRVSTGLTPKLLGHLRNAVSPLHVAVVSSVCRTFACGRTRWCPSSRVRTRRSRRAETHRHRAVLRLGFVRLHRGGVVMMGFPLLLVAVPVSAALTSMRKYSAMRSTTL